MPGGHIKDTAVNYDLRFLFLIGIVTAERLFRVGAFFKSHGLNRAVRHDVKLCVAVDLYRLKRLIIG